MKKLKSVGQYFVALALAVVVSINSIVPAHAVDPNLILQGISILVSVVQIGQQAYQQATTDAERSEALASVQDTVNRYWRRDSQTPFDDALAIRVDSDELSRVAADLTLQGFPCEVVSYGYMNAGGVYSYVWVIQGVGDIFVPNVLEPDYDGGFGGNDISLRYRYFTHEGQWLYAEGSPSSAVLRNLYNKLSDFYDSVEEGFYQMVNGFLLINERVKYLTGYIAGFEDDSTVPSVMSKIDDLITAVENISVAGDAYINLDTTPITSKLEQVASSIRSVIITANDTSALEDSIKSFQYDFDDTFSDLKHLYPTEAVETIRDGSVFEWGSADMINSVTPSVPGTTVYIYRQPDYFPLNIEETDGAFYLSNGGSLPVSLDYRVAGVWEQISLYSGDESETVTGTDITITNAFEGRPLSFEVFGRSVQNGTPSLAAERVVPVDGEWDSGLPYVNITSGSVAGYATSYGHDFDTGGTPMGHGIPVDFGGNYTDANGQQWLCDVVDWCYDIPGSTAYGKYTKNIGVLTLNGSADENWTFDSTTSNPHFIFNLGVVDRSAASRHYMMCDTFPYIVNSGVSEFNTRGVYYTVVDGDGHSGFVFGVGDFISSESLWRAWLAVNPVTVYYPLPEPEVFVSTYSYNEPMLSGIYNHITADYGSRIRITYATGSPYTALYSDTDGNWYKQRSDGVSEQITGSSAAMLNSAFSYKKYSNAADIQFNAGTNIIELSSGELTIDYIKGSKFFNWLYLYLTNFDTGGSMDTDALLDKLTDIENALTNIGGDVNIENNTNIDINEDNDSYNVFYVQDPETGEDTSIIDLSGDALTAFGKLLNFLYQVGFKDALDGVGETVGDLSDFYMDSAEGSVDVWAS